MVKALKVLAAVDFSEASVEALHWGAGLARAAGGELVLLAVTDWPGRTPGTLESEFPAFYDADEGLKALIQQRLKALADSLHGEPLSRLLVRFGFAETEIIKAAREVSADLIVMGTHGRKGVARALVGSVAEGVIRNAPCAVTVIRQGVHPAPEKLMAAARETAQEAGRAKG